MRGFASKTGFAPHDLSGLERWVFGGTLPTLTLQHAFYRPEVVSVQDVVAMFFYFMHFPLPIVVGFVFWVRSREHYRRFVAALLFMALLSFVTYLFWPSAPPWSAASPLFRDYLFGPPVSCSSTSAAGPCRTSVYGLLGRSSRQLSTFITTIPRRRPSPILRGNTLLVL